MSTYKCSCGEEVGAIGIMCTDETYPEGVCGKCGTPLCTDCVDDSRWTFDDYPCCTPCSDDLQCNILKARAPVIQVQKAAIVGDNVHVYDEE